MRGSWIPLALGLAACGPVSVSGTVDGDRIGGARSAIFDTLEVNLGVIGNFTAMLILVSDLPDACQVFEDFSDVVEPTCDDRCDEYAGIAEDAGLSPRSYWSENLWIVADDGEYEATFDYEDDIPEAGEFQLVHNGWDAEPLFDSGDCEDACEDGDLLEADIETGDGGDLEILEYDERDFVRGRFEVTMGNDEELKGSFTAEYCDMTDWIPFIGQFL